mgnify:CR=1 FL=1
MPRSGSWRFSRQWKAPANFKIELFVVRVGEWGGHMLVDCDDPATVHKVCSTWPAFVFEARPVIPVEDAVRVELEAIAWRDGLKRKLTFEQDHIAFTSCDPGTLSVQGRRTQQSG